MAGYNNYNGQNNSMDFTKVHANTNSIDMYSGDVRLALYFYDKAIQIRLTNAVTIDGKRRFPKDSALGIMLTADRVAAFTEIMINGLLPAISEGKTFERTLPVNQDGSSMIKIELDETGNVFFMIFVGIDADRRPKNGVRYMFTNTIPLGKYDEKTGEYEVGDPIRAQLAMFVKAFESFNFNVSAAAQHFQKYDSRFESTRILSMLESMASKLGASTGSRPSYQTGASYANNQQFAAEPAIQPANTLGDMMGSANDEGLPF